MFHARLNAKPYDSEEEAIDAILKGKVVPGDMLRLETKIIKQKGPVGIGEATASVDGKVVASGQLTFMIG